MKERFLSKAKRVDNGEWITGYYCECFLCNQPGNYNTIGDRWYQFKDAKQGSISNGETGGVKVLTNTLCQCTGIKDINGDLIFEGDLLEVPSGWCGDTFFSSVIRQVFYGTDGAWDVMAPQFDFFSSCEIVGNIHTR